MAATPRPSTTATPPTDHVMGCPPGNRQTNKFVVVTIMSSWVMFVKIVVSYCIGVMVTSCTDVLLVIVLVTIASKIISVSGNNYTIDDYHALGFSYIKNIVLVTIVLLVIVIVLVSSAASYYIHIKPYFLYITNFICCAINMIYLDLYSLHVPHASSRYSF